MMTTTTGLHQLHPSRPSDLSTAMAAKFTRKRLFLVLLLPAIITFLVPFVLLLFLRILDAASSGYGMLSLLSACLLTGLIVQQIRTLAPSPEKSKRAMESRLQFFWMFLVVCLLFFRGMAMLVRFSRGGVLEAAWGGGQIVGSRVGDQAGTLFEDPVRSSSDTPSVSATRILFFYHVSTPDVILMAYKLAMGVIILGMIVGIRFLGPAAVVQCSTFPVPSSSIGTMSSSSFMKSNTWERNGRAGSNDGNARLDRFLVCVVYYPLQWLRTLVMPTPTPTPPLEQEQQELLWGGTSRLPPTALKGMTSTSTTSTLPTHPVWQVQSLKEVKRYESPGLSRTLLLLFLHGYFGALFAQCTILPLLLLHRGFHETVTNHVVCSCALLSSFTFLATYIIPVDAKAHHELDMVLVMDAIKHMQQNNKDAIAMMRNMLVYIANMVWKQIVSCGFLFYWSVTPFLCLGIIGCNVQPSSWLQSTQSQASAGSNYFMLWPCLQAIVISTVVTLIMSLYIMASDIALRVILLLPGLNAHRFILMSGAKEQDLEVEDVMVEIILGGLGAGFLEYTVAPRLIVDLQGNLEIPNASSKKRGYSTMGMIGGINNEYDLEEEELRRNDTMTWLVQRCIEQGSICGYTTLEDDLLKLNILESFGGNSTPAESDRMDFSMMGLSERHYREIARRILTPEPPKGTRIQPPMVPVLRALSAYIGGIGASLSTSRATTFYISPCTKTTLEYAVNAASRFIVLNIDRRVNDGYSKKRFNRISLMIPVILEAIYRLRCGICDLACCIYEHDQSSKSSTTVGINGKKTSDNGNRKAGLWVIQSRERLDSILSTDPSLEHLVSVCDKAARCIMKTVKDVDGSIDFDAKVRADGCRQWLVSFE